MTLPQTYQKPLATLGDALRAKGDTPTLLSRPQPPSNDTEQRPRVEPPSSRPSRIPVYNPPPPPEPPRLPPAPEGPDRSLVEAGAPPTSRKPRQMHDDEFRANAVKRALESIGRCTQQEIAQQLGISQSNLSRWIREAQGRPARQRSPADPPAAPAPPASTRTGDEIVTVSRELAEALARVKALKARLRELLGA